MSILRVCLWQTSPLSRATLASGFCVTALAKNKKDTEAVLPRLFAKRDVKKLIYTIHEAGGIAVLAHPACYWAISLEKLVKDLINNRMYDNIRKLFGKQERIGVTENVYYALNNFCYFTIQFCILLTLGMQVFNGSIALASFILIERY